MNRRLLFSWMPSYEMDDIISENPDFFLQPGNDLVFSYIPKKCMSFKVCCAALDASIYNLSHIREDMLSQYIIDYVYNILTRKYSYMDEDDPNADVWITIERIIPEEYLQVPTGKRAKPSYPEE